MLHRWDCSNAGKGVVASVAALEGNPSDILKLGRNLAHSSTNSKPPNRNVTDPCAREGVFNVSVFSVTVETEGHHRIRRAARSTGPDGVGCQGVVRGGVGGVVIPEGRVLPIRRVAAEPEVIRKAPDGDHRGYAEFRPQHEGGGAPRANCTHARNIRSERSSTGVLVPEAVQYCLLRASRSADWGFRFIQAIVSDSPPCQVGLQKSQSNATAATRASASIREPVSW